MSENTVITPKQVKVNCGIFGRNEANNLPRMIQPLKNQTLPFNKIIYVDDASTDGSVDVAASFSLEIYKLTHQHPSWLTTPMLGVVVQATVDKIYETKDLDFFMLIGCDTVLAPNCLEFLVQKMRENPKLACCSGVIVGEYSSPHFPRGTGRLYRVSFWNKYVKAFPFSYTWESYPVYKAQMLGLETKSFSQAKMYGLRPTAPYKGLYGCAMRELGYFPFYALARCFLSMFRGKVGFEMLKNYMISPYKVFDENIKQWVRLYECKQILQFLRDPKQIKQAIQRGMR